MKIADIQIGTLKVPLVTPFKTALRRVDALENVVIKIITDEGAVGYGEAPPTGAVTGDTFGGIIGAIQEHIKPSILGKTIEQFEELMLLLEKSVVGNKSAKAAVDMALYDLYGQYYKVPVYKLLGGHKKVLETDITISVNDPDEMVKDSLKAVEQGYSILKIKVGKDISLDIKRMDAIREALGDDISLRLDANQGWSPKEAVQAIKSMESRGFNIDFIEQPVKAEDHVGLKYVTEHVQSKILADESVFSPKDAVEIITNRCADMVNIKLMKTGGIKNALRLVSIAEIYNIECMIGCMLESKLSVGAAAHLAAAKSIITHIDLDGPVLCAQDPIQGGVGFDHYRITIPDEPGFGIKEIEGVTFK